MNLLNTKFLKLLFFIVILILIYKSYILYCGSNTERFQDSEDYNASKVDVGNDVLKGNFDLLDYGGGYNENGETTNVKAISTTSETRTDIEGLRFTIEGGADGIALNISVSSDKVSLGKFMKDDTITLESGTGPLGKPAVLTVSENILQTEFNVGSQIKKSSDFTELVFDSETILTVTDDNKKSIGVLQNIDSYMLLPNIGGGNDYVRKSVNKRAVYLNGINSRLVLPNLNYAEFTLRFIFKSLTQNKTVFYTVDQNLNNSIKLLITTTNKLKLVYGDQIILVDYKYNDWNYVEFHVDEVKFSLNVNNKKDERETTLARNVKHIVFFQSYLEDNYLDGYLSSIELSDIVNSTSGEQTKKILLDGGNNIKSIFYNINTYDKLRTTRKEIKMGLFNGVNSFIHIPQIEHTNFSISFYLKPISKRNFTLISSHSGNWSIKVIESTLIIDINGKALGYEPNERPLLEDIRYKINYDTFYHFTLCVKSDKVKIQLNNRYIETKHYGIMKTNDIIIGCIYDKVYKDFFKGYMGDIIINFSRYLSFKQICEYGGCSESIVDHNPEKINDYLEKMRMLKEETMLKNKENNITEQDILNEKKRILQKRITSRELAIDKGFLSEEDEFETPEKVDLITQAQGNNIKLMWLPPENGKKAVERYLIVMKKKKSGVIKNKVVPNNKNIRTIVSDFLNYEFKNHFLNENGEPIIPEPNRKQIYNYKVSGSGKAPIIHLIKLEKDGNFYIPTFNITGGYDFKDGDLITLNSNTNNENQNYVIELKESDLKFENNWSAPYLIFPKNKDCKFCSYTFKNLNKKYKYKFAIIAIGKTDSNMENNISHLVEDEDPELDDYVHAEFPKENNVDNDKNWEEKVICQNDGTFNIYQADENTTMKCEEHPVSNVGFDHDTLMNYLGTSDNSMNLGIYF